MRWYSVPLEPVRPPGQVAGGKAPPAALLMMRLGARLSTLDFFFDGMTLRLLRDGAFLTVGCDPRGPGVRIRQLQSRVSFPGRPLRRQALRSA